MADFMHPLFAADVIDCIAQDRQPTVRELFVVAERIWSDGAANRSAFGWGKLGPASHDRVMSIKAAQLALCGVPAAP